MEVFSFIPSAKTAKTTAVIRVQWKAPNPSTGNADATGSGRSRRRRRRFNRITRREQNDRTDARRQIFWDITKTEVAVTRASQPHSTSFFGTNYSRLAGTLAPPAAEFNVPI